MQKTRIGDRNGNWTHDKPTRVGQSHIWFRDNGGMVVILPIATLRIVETSDEGGAKFEIDGHRVTIEMWGGIVSVLETMRFPERPRNIVPVSIPKNPEIVVDNSTATGV